MERCRDGRRRHHRQSNLTLVLVSSFPCTEGDFILLGCGGCRGHMCISAPTSTLGGVFVWYLTLPICPSQRISVVMMVEIVKGGTVLVMCSNILVHWYCPHILVGGLWANWYCSQIEIRLRRHQACTNTLTQGKGKGGEGRVGGWAPGLSLSAAWGEVSSSGHGLLTGMQKWREKKLTNGLKSIFTRADLAFVCLQYGYGCMYSNSAFFIHFEDF